MSDLFGSRFSLFDGFYGLSGTSRAWYSMFSLGLHVFALVGAGAVLDVWYLEANSTRGLRDASPKSSVLRCLAPDMAFTQK